MSPQHPQHPLPVTTPYSQLLQEAQVPERAGLQLADVVHAQVSGRKQRQRFLISHAVVCIECTSVPGSVAPLC